jgi:hypothetical protein
MRKIAMSLAAATALAATAIPASAQGVYVGFGDGGFGAGVARPYYGSSPYYSWGGPYPDRWGYRYAGSPHYAYGATYPAYGYGYGYAWRW